MVAKRRTVRVADLVDMVNNICKDSAENHRDIRQGAMNVLESVLHSTGNYYGFRYLLKDEVEDGEPGVNYDVNECGVMVPHPDHEKRFANTDCTRVMYYF